MSKTRITAAPKTGLSAALLVCALLAVSGTGCVALHTGPLPPPEHPIPPAQRAPHELCKTSLPPYTIEPPDILLIDAVRVSPKPPYKIQSLDVVQIVVQGTLPDQPISGAFTIE